MPENHENFEKLQKNKEAVLAFATEISEERPAGIPEAEKGRILGEGKDALEQGDFSTAIQKMDQLKDARLGIEWHESEDLGQGTRAVVRDAREVTTDKEALKQDAGEKYAMQALNEVRAAIGLLDTDAATGPDGNSLSEEAKAAAKESLIDVARYTLDQIEKDPRSLNDKTIKEINTYIVDALEKTGIEGAGEKLNFAKEVANFKDEHKHIVTMTSVQDRDGNPKTVIEADVMLNGLTDSQKEMYQKIDAADRGAQIEDLDGKMAWYNDMPKYKREMMHDVAGDIAEGNKVIPAQLLKDAPGMRNAYDKVTAVQHEAGKEPVVVAESLHSGTLATKIKPQNSGLSEKEIKEQQASIVADNVEQLQTFVPEGKRVNLNNLASETPLNVRGENFIQKQSEKVAKGNEKVVVTASPINRWRRLGGGREQTEFDNTLKNIGGDLSEKENLKNTAKYLQKGDNRLVRFASKVTFGLIKTNFRKAEQELNNLSETDPKLASVLKETISTKQRINETTVFSRTENINLEISAKMAIIDNAVDNKKGALHEITSPETKKQLAVAVKFCKSGKDRTGLVMMETSHQAASQELGIDPNSKQGKANKLSMVAGGHTQEMAGIQGGTTGCHSIKTNPEFGLGRSDKALDGVINQKSAKFNSSIKTVKDKDKVKDVAIAKVKDGIQSSPSVVAVRQEHSMERAQSQRRSIGPELAREARENNPSRKEAKKLEERQNAVASNRKSVSGRAR